MSQREYFVLYKEVCDLFLKEEAACRKRQDERDVMAMRAHRSGDIAAFERYNQDSVTEQKICEKLTEMRSKFAGSEGPEKRLLLLSALPAMERESADLRLASEKNS